MSRSKELDNGLAGINGGEFPSELGLLICLLIDAPEEIADIILFLQEFFLEENSDRE